MLLNLLGMVVSNCYLGEKIENMKTALSFGIPEINRISKETISLHAELNKCENMRPILNLLLSTEVGIKNTSKLVEIVSREIEQLEADHPCPPNSGSNNRSNFSSNPFGPICSGQGYITRVKRLNTSLQCIYNQIQELKSCLGNINAQIEQQLNKQSEKQNEKQVDD